MGNIVAPKEIMTEAELREWMPSIVGDTEANEIWKEKAEKDPIEEIIDYLRRASYEVTEIE